MYRIKDLQLYRYFANGQIFDTKEEAVKQLISFHDVDFSGTDDDDHKLNIDEYFEYHGINQVDEKLNWLMEYGDWEVEEHKIEED